MRVRGESGLMVRRKGVHTAEVCVFFFKMSKHVLQIFKQVLKILKRKVKKIKFPSYDVAMCCQCYLWCGCTWVKEWYVKIWIFEQMLELVIEQWQWEELTQVAWLGDSDWDVAEWGRQQAMRIGFTCYSDLPFWTYHRNLYFQKFPSHWKPYRMYISVPQST